MPIYASLKKSGERVYDAIIRVPKLKGGTRQVQRRFRLKKDAQRWIDRNSVAVDQGTYKELIKSTFYQFLHEFWMPTFLTKFHLKYSTINAYKSNIQKHLMPRLGHLSMTGITRAEITRFQTDLSRILTTPKNVLGQLRKMLNDAVDNDFIRVNPMLGMKKLGGKNEKDKQRRGRALKPEQIHLLLNAEKKNKKGKLRPMFDAEARLMIWMALLSGLRQGEQFAVKWENEDDDSFVDFENNVIVVKRSLFWNYGETQEEIGTKFILTTPKSKYAVRAVDMSLELKKMLKEHRFKAQDKTGFVFQSSPGTPVNANNFYTRVFKPGVQAAGLGDFRWHDLRHTYGSLLLDQDEDPVYVSRQMGHSNVSITFDIYLHLIRKHRPKAIAKLDRLLFGESSK